MITLARRMRAGAAKSYKTSRASASRFTEKLKQSSNTLVIKLCPFFFNFEEYNKYRIQHKQEELSSTSCNICGVYKWNYHINYQRIVYRPTIVMLF